MLAQRLRQHQRRSQTCQVRHHIRQIITEERRAFNPIARPERLVMCTALPGQFDGTVYPFRQLKTGAQYRRGLAAELAIVKWWTATYAPIWARDFVRMPFKLSTFRALCRAHTQHPELVLAYHARLLILADVHHQGRLYQTTVEELQQLLGSAGFYGDPRFQSPIRPPSEVAPVLWPFNPHEASRG